MTDIRPNYIVTAPTFHPNNGGAIFQHELVHALNSFGETAFLYPQPTIKQPLRSRLSRMRRNPISYWYKQPYEVKPDLNTPIARRWDFKPNSIIVYPEIVMGNPLRGKNVVRWLLYIPGLFHPYEFGKDDMFFRVGEITDLPEVTGGAPDLELWKINPAYRNENRPDRKGACYIVRKGRDKPRIPQTADAIFMDDMSHAEMAEVFNQCEVFYSYDEASFYSQYAAMCGCVSIIVPGIFKSRAEWVAQHELGQYGVAYGLDDTEHAIATRHLVEGMLLQKQADGLETVKQFITLTQARFGAAAVGRK